MTSPGLNGTFPAGPRSAGSRPADAERVPEQSEAPAKRREWSSESRSDQAGYRRGTQRGADRAAAGGEAASDPKGRLGKTVSSSSAVLQERRKKRFELREKMRRCADRTPVPFQDRDPDTGQVVKTGERALEDRFIACGHRRYGDSVGVVFDSDSGRAAIKGTTSCSSVWVCPVCASAIQRHRAGELGQVLAWARREKLTVAMVTLTVRHSAKHPLSETIDQATGEVVAGVWDAISSGWASVTSGSQWVSESEEAFVERLETWETARQLALEGKGRMPRGGRKNIAPIRRIGDQEKFQVKGWARAVEVTHGLNGWHVHVHAVLVLGGERDQATSNAFALGSSMWERWSNGIGKHGFTALKHQGGLDVRVSAAAEKRLAEYLQKDGLADTEEHLKASLEAAGRKAAAEAIMGAGKQARRGGRTPFQILDDLDLDNPGRDFALWREWVEGSKGRRQLTWSAALRELAGLATSELTDEEIVDQDLGGDVAVILPGETWDVIRSTSWQVLDVMENQGPAGLITWLRHRGLRAEFAEPPGSNPEPTD